MFISLSRTYVQNFSNWHALFVFFITFCSRCGMVWDTACRPTDDPFWAFLSPGAQKPAEPPNNICSLSAAEKKNILGIHLRKIIIPVPFYSKAFVLLQKFETSWALIGRLSRGFFSFTISGASNFKYSFAFHEPVLDLACLCESFLVESPILYLAFFKTILAALFGTLGLPLRFLPSKPSLLHDHFTTQHSDFPSFLAVITTDKPVNRSIHA